MSPRLLSVRMRLTLLYAGMLTFIVFAFSLALFYIVGARVYRDLDLHLAQQLSAVEKVYAGDRDELDELESQVGIALFEVVDRGKVLFRTAAWESGGLEASLEEGVSAARTWIAADGRAYRVTQAAGPSYRLAVALPEASTRKFLWTLAAVLLVSIPCAAGLSVLVGYFLARRVLAPVGVMAEKARSLSEDTLGERLPAENPYDEFGRLAGVLNEALSRVHGSFDQLRRFTADASHELRTPLTTMRSIGEVALHRPLGSAAYRDVIGSMLEEVGRLTRLVESLLTLTRAESGAVRLSPESVELCALTEEVAEQLRILAEEKAQDLHVDTMAPVRIVGDRDMLRRGVMNVLHNAIKYTPSRGSIRVAVRKASATEATIEIRDSGPGIPARHHARIFDRFYRVDEGRSRMSGGIGLGLAIARCDMEINGGRIELESEPGEGSLFRIVLPTKGGRVEANA